MIDITKVESVEIIVDENHKIWINVDGECKLRIQRADFIRFEGPSDVEFESDIRLAEGFTE